MVGAIKTHHLMRGNRGRELVLIHGFGSSTYTWRRNLDALAARYRVHALDVKGFGLSAKPKDGQYHVSAYTEHLLGYLDTMKLEKPVLVGSSMGGEVAVRVAMLRPDRVSGLVLVDPAPVEVRGGPERADGTTKAGVNLARQALGGGFQRWVGPAMLQTSLTRQAVAAGLRASYHDPSLVTEEMIEAYYRPITIEGAREAIAAMMNPPPAKALPPLSSLELPTLILWGKFDRIVPRRVAESYVESIPQSRLVIFDRSGHLPHEEEPERFVRELTTFVDHLP